MADNDSPGMSGLLRLAPIAIGFLIIGGIALRGCKEGPFGRSQLITVSYDQEYQLGRQAYQQILSKSRVVENDPIVPAVRRVADRLRRASEDPEVRKKLHLDPNVELKWEYNVIQDRQINAFCLPGGKVACFRAFSRSRRRKPGWPWCWAMRSDMPWLATVRSEYRKINWFRLDK